jgi:site-specific recombinase XerD
MLGDDRVGRRLVPPQSIFGHAIRDRLHLVRSETLELRRVRGERAGMPFAIFPHMLRHACGFALANAGHDTRALQAWLGHKNIQHTVRYTELAPDSLRAGFVTSAVKRGANLFKITDVTGHRSLEMLKTYSRDAEAFVGHAGAGVL